MHKLIFTFLSISVAANCYADTKKCIDKLVRNGDDTLTLGEIRSTCTPKETKDIEVITVTSSRPTTEIGAGTQRLIAESETQFEPFVITPHFINYILPVYTTNAVNTEPFSDIEGYQDNLRDIESKFQISFKIPINSQDILFEDDALYFGFTLKALWQVYSEGISRPFRETNYRPEIFYLTPLPFSPYGGNTGLAIGFEHESNGQNQMLSRSWDRVYADFLFEKGGLVLSFRPWYRLSENPKDFPLAPKGDDNPDIEDFMGYFELGLVYKYNGLQFNGITRRNSSTNNGAIELGMTFPLWGKMRGYATIFNGYGDTLIDYNYKQTRFGLGIAISDWL